MLPRTYVGCVKIRKLPSAAVEVSTFVRMKGRRHSLTGVHRLGLAAQKLDSHILHMSPRRSYRSFRGTSRRWRRRPTLSGERIGARRT